MSGKKFTKDHEWVVVTDGVATVGITDYAQSALGDIVYVELPEAGRALSAGGDAAVVESVKAASEVYAPLNGTVTEANAALDDDPALVNGDAEGAGWFFKMTVDKPDQLDGLMDAAAYQAFIEELDS